MAARLDKKDYKFTLLLYPDSLSYDCQEVLKKVRECSRFQYFAYVLHDSDRYAWDDEAVLNGADGIYDENNEVVSAVVHEGDPKKPHYHVFVEMFNRAVTTCKAVSTLLGLSSNFVQNCGSASSMLRYLVHADNPEKFQYSDSYVVCSTGDFCRPLLHGTADADSKSALIYEFIVNNCVCDLKQLLEWSFGVGCFSEVRRGMCIWRDLIFDNRVRKASDAEAKYIDRMVSDNV